MEMWTLDDAFQPVDIVENYESLIWSERFFKNGDFQLTSADIGNTIKTLPEGSYVTLRDSTVPMKVEWHNIKKPDSDPNTEQQIVVTGRTCDICWLEIRASVRELRPSAKRLPWFIQAPVNKESDAAFEAMRTVFGDVAQYQLGDEVLAAIAPAASPKDAIPQLKLILPADYSVTTWDSTTDFSPNEVVAYSGNMYVAIQSLGTPNVNKIPASQPTFWTLLTASTGLTPLPSTNYEIKAQDLYQTVSDLIAVNHHGIKSIRPDTSSSQVGIEIYQGTDRRNTVHFDAKLDQIKNAQYLLGKADEKNIAYVYGNDGSASIKKNSGVGYVEPDGLNRKVLVVDFNEDATVNGDVAKQTRGVTELYKNNATALFGGEVAIQVADEYNKSYFLGDVLRLVGDYDLVQDVRVAEFIRTQDNTGETAYPTFEEVVS